MDFDTGILSLIDGYVSEALNTTGTKRAIGVAPRPEPQFEGDTIPDVPAYVQRIEVPEDFDDIKTGVVAQQRLIR